MRKNKILSIVLQDIENEYKDKYLENWLFNMQQEAGGSIQFTDFEEQVEKEKEWKRVVSSVTDTINGAFGNVNIKQTYLVTVKKLLPECYEECAANFAEKRMNYEDLFPMAYLKFLRGDIRPYHKISQIVVDEAQEYSPIIYILLSKIFTGAKFTILGDVSQKTNSDGCGIESIADFFPKKQIKYYRLNRSYRSTKEINDYLKTVDTCTDNRDIKYLDRSGHPVDFVKISSVEEVADILSDFRNEKHLSNAIICRSFSDCKKLYEKLKKSARVYLVGEEDSVSPGQNVIIPSYLVKGLEFDAVIVADRRKEFSGEDNLFYVSCSRALHRLAVAEFDNEIFE